MQVTNFLLNRVKQAKARKKNADRVMMPLAAQARLKLLLPLIAAR
jgi:hypothetical protein